MTTYTPDRWIIFRITKRDDPTESELKVMGSWYGGFASADSWRMNSGITSVTVVDDDHFYIFHGYSRSDYVCHKDNYGAHLTAHGFLENLKKTYKIEKFDTHEAAIAAIKESFEE